jgi:hypothetical protein
MAKPPPLEPNPVPLEGRHAMVLLLAWIFAAGLLFWAVLA